jgi:hypothetical protein
VSPLKSNSKSKSFTGNDKVIALFVYTFVRPRKHPPTGGRRGFFVSTILGVCLDFAGKSKHCPLSYQAPSTQNRGRRILPT